MSVFIGSGADPTFRYLVTQLKHRGLNGNVVDLGHLILAGDLSLPLDGTPGELILHGRKTELSGAVVARLIDIAAAAPSAGLGARARSVQISLARYLRQLPWETTIGSEWDNSNFSKVYQLSLAADRSWSIPQTCLTNDPVVAREFVISHNAIFKGASSYKSWAARFTAEHMQRISSVAGSPVLFQELVRGYDVRVHVVGARVFGEAIYSDDCDYRMDKNARFQFVDVPHDVAKDCVEFCSKMRLLLSGIDFKVTDAGRWYFLELNSAPCLQGYDRRANGAISDALATCLLANCARD